MISAYTKPERRNSVETEKGGAGTSNMKHRDS